MKQPDDPTLPHFHVMQFELKSGHGWTSLHTTADGAEATLIELANDWGIRTPDGGPVESVEDIDEHPEVASYGLFHLPVWPN